MYWILDVSVIVEFFLYKLVSDDALFWFEMFSMTTEDASVQWYRREKGEWHRSETRRLGADRRRYREKAME